MEQGERRIRERPVKRKKGIPPIIIIIVFFIIIALLGLGYTLAEIYMPNFKVVDYYEYHENLDKSKINIMLEDKFLGAEYSPVMENGEIYLPVEFLKEHVDKYIYWDNKTKRLTITNEHNVIRMNTDDLTYYVNSRPMTLNLALYYMDGTAYMPGLFLEDHYNIRINYDKDNNMAWVDYGKKDIEKALTIKKNVYFRFEADKKSPVIKKLAADTEVYIYGENGNYSRIRTMDGLVGYVLTKDLSEIELIKGYIPSENPPEYKEPKEIAGKINMVWDMMEYVEANASEKSRTPHYGLDVLSPQWFRFDREGYSGANLSDKDKQENVVNQNKEGYSGEILSIADLGYVEWAHAQGYQVWAMLFDEEDGEVTAQILSDQEKRENVIRQILGFVAMYNLDGINIDFERVREVDVQYFHQFLRELWPLLKEQGVVLSVDTFVPSAWSMYYSRAEIAQTVDYICVMTYDENTYGGSSGPNASVGFVENGVINTLKEVPPEKLIMGIPFYNRVWIETETSTGTDYKIRSLGMNYAYRLFTENGAEFVWQEDLGCYYGEYDIVEDGVKKKYRTWLEDERSIAAKLEIVKEYDLAGVCAWVRGLEKAEIWDVLYEGLK